MGSEEKRKVVILSAPSGSGKTTLAKHLLAAIPELAFSVSACSRPKRTGEVDGKDYFFFTVSEFREKIQRNEFVEYEEVYPDRFYGTLFSEVEKIWNMGEVVLFDVDVIGGVNIKKIYGDNALAVFIRPPSIEELRKRLVSRATDPEKDIQTRLKKAELEMGFESQFDVTIVNDELEKAKSEIVSIVTKFIHL